MSVNPVNISIVIPVLNDAPALAHCLESLHRANSESVSTQIIVVDGGPSEDCKRAALAAGAEYLIARRGRASQMNAGAKLARGEWLWFLHADCAPHPDSLQAILDLSTTASWGCFKHRVDAPGLGLRVIECADNLRAKLLSLPYGDQGIFVRRDLFEKIGGYVDVPLLEDVMLAQALKKVSRARVLKPLLESSARRWLQRGVLRTTLTNWKIMWLYLAMRRKPEALAAIYRGNAKADAASTAAPASRP